MGRHAAHLASGGLAAVVPAKRGPKGPHKVTPTVLAVIEQDHGKLGPSALTRRIEEHTGVVLSVPHVCRLMAVQTAQTELAVEDSGEADAGNLDAVAMEPGGAPAATALEQPSQAPSFDPPATLPSRVHGRYMGLALYYPALTATGLLDAARTLFILPRSERFGVRATTLSMFFMTLLSKPTLESAKHLRRVEFGTMVGSGRAPSVKTLRRKLAALVSQNRAAEFGTRLARRWVETGLVATAYLYVDGHMQVYTGKRQLQKVWNSQRRMPLPGIHTYHVSDVQGRPLLFLTEPLSPNLAKAVPRIVEVIRETLGDRTFTLIFDRGGYDGTLFRWLREQRIDFITYQRGEPKRPNEVFTRRETRFEGRRMRFMLAEDHVRVGGIGPWRRIVVRAKDGHQTPILTSFGADTGGARIACLMFARWRQENIFKYMGEHHGLDTLVSYAGGPVEPDTVIPNPECKRHDRQIAKLKKQLRQLKAGLGDALLDEPRHNSRTAHGLKIAQAGSVRELRALEDRIAQLTAERKALPTHVPVKDSGITREAMSLEHKAIVDRIKISAYNTEEWLLDRLVRHYANPHDARDLLRAFTELSGEIATTRAGVVVTLDPPDTPIHQRALAGLVDELNTAGSLFPGTDVPVTYRVAVHHSQVAA